MDPAAVSSTQALALHVLHAQQPIDDRAVPSLYGVPLKYIS